MRHMGIRFGQFWLFLMLGKICKNNVQSSSNTIESFTLIETPNRKKEGKIKNEKSISYHTIVIVSKQK